MVLNPLRKMTSTRGGILEWTRETVSKQISTFDFQFADSNNRNGNMLQIR